MWHRAQALPSGKDNDLQRGPRCSWTAGFVYFWGTDIARFVSLWLPVSFCLKGKDKEEGGRFKSNTSPGSHGSVWSSIICLHPPCASLELGCFHGDQVFDGQACVWWLVRCEGFHTLLSSKQHAQDLACLAYLHINIFCKYFAFSACTVLPSLTTNCRN